MKVRPIIWLSIRAEDKVNEVRQYILAADIAFTQMALIFYHYEVLQKDDPLPINLVLEAVQEYCEKRFLKEEENKQ